MPSVGFDDPKELLFRQVRSGWFKDGRLTTQSFLPQADEDKKPSVFRSSLTTAETCFRYITETCKMDSIGSWAVSVAECDTEAVPLIHDPVMSPPEKAENSHSLLDLSGCASRSKGRSLCTKLARLANERGCLFSPRVTDEPRNETE
jgi:hypothetical protein